MFSQILLVIDAKYISGPKTEYMFGMYFEILLREIVPGLSVFGTLISFFTRESCQTHPKTAVGARSVLGDAILWLLSMWVCDTFISVPQGHSQLVFCKRDA